MGTLGSLDTSTSSNFYRISANHTNVQLSPKKQYVNFLHFLSSAIEINRWWRLKTLLVSPSPRLQSVVSALVFAYLFIIICTDPMYVTAYMIAEIFRESSQMTVQPIMHRL